MTQQANQGKLILQNYRNKDLIEGLTWIYDQAINGEISGCCFIIKHNHFKHSIGVIGHYRNDPYTAIRACKRLKKLINQYADDLEDHTEFNIEFET